MNELGGGRCSDEHFFVLRGAVDGSAPPAADRVDHRRQTHADGPNLFDRGQHRLL